MDTTTILIFALVIGSTILSLVLKVMFSKAYDSIRNERIMRKNAMKSPESNKLSDFHDTRSNNDY